MWQPLYVKLDRFISHEDTKYDFDLGVPQLINGLNMDDEGQVSNGSGKSAIVEACRHTLLGDSFRKVKQQELIMDEEGWGETRMALYNTQSGKTLEIGRRIHPKKATELDLLVDGEPVKFSTVNDGNSKILAMLGITREDLISYFIVSKDSHEPFFTSSDTEKKRTIARFSGTDAIGNVDDIIGSEQDAVEESIAEVDRKVSSLQGKVEAYEEQLENVDSQDEQRRKIRERIKSIEEEIEQKEESAKEILEDAEDIRDNQIPSKESRAEEIQGNVDDLRDQIEKISTEDLQERLDEIDAREQELSKKRKSYRETLNEYEGFLSELQVILKESVKCPECGHEFSVKDDEISIEEARNQIPDVEGLISRKREGKEKVEKKISKVDEDRKKRQDALNKARKLKKETNRTIDNLEAEKRKVERDIKDLGDQINRKVQRAESIQEDISALEDDLENMRSKEPEDLEAPIRESISKAEEEIRELGEERVSYERKIEELKQWSHRFKKFRTHLSNKSIMSIEAFTNFYLKKMHCNLNVGLEGYKVLSNGEVRDNITIHVKRNGIPEGSFEKFSGGERVRMVIANILCLQKLINLNSPSGGLDLLVLDEIIDRVDPEGVAEILKSLTFVKQTVRVITHSPTSQSFIDDVTVIKEGGSSRLETTGTVTDYIGDGEDEKA